MRRKSYRHVRVDNKTWNTIKNSNDIRLVIYSYLNRNNGVTEDEIENWLAIDFNPAMTPAMCKYWLPEMESHGEIYLENGMWYAGEVSGELGRRRNESLRRSIRMLILENVGTKGYKMIFLAGLPGGGKSTLLRQLDIEHLFTNCNIDNFFEPTLEPNFGTKNLHKLKKNFFKWHYLRKDKLAAGEELTPAEIAEYEEAARLNRLERSLFGQAIDQFKEQITDICTIGSNFIIDGTAVGQKRTREDKERFESLGYDCAMIFVDIDTETSVERNLSRGEKGGRAIYSGIIRDMGPKMQDNVESYRQLFGENFFLVSNKGSLDDYISAIEGIRSGVQQFMES